MNDKKPLLSFELGYIKENLVISFLLAPILPVSWSLWFTALCTVLSAAAWGLVTSAIYKTKAGQVKEPIAKVFLDERLSEELHICLTNTLATLLVLGWLAASGVLHSLESFFPVLVGLQILSGSAIIFLAFNAIKREQS